MLTEKNKIKYLYLWIFKHLQQPSNVNFKTIKIQLTFINLGFNAKSLVSTREVKIIIY